MPARFLILLALLAAAAPLPAQDAMYVRRGEVVREGRVWVEGVNCGAGVEEGARLVLRADVGSINVKTGPERRLECRILLRAYTPDEQEARQLFNRFEVGLRATEDGGAYLRGGWVPGAQPPARLITPGQ